MPDPDRFAEEWAAAWNAGDLERVIAHYAPDVTFRSPVAAAFAGDGLIVGRDALHAYWSKALARHPGLRFTVLGVFRGHEGMAIRYVGPAGREVVEAFEFDAEGRIIRSQACYA